MFYDVSILTLMIIGVAGILVYSYKMSRSRVYPVGIVRKLPIVHAEHAAELPIDAVVFKQWTDLEKMTVVPDARDYWVGHTQKRYPGSRVYHYHGHVGMKPHQRPIWGTPPIAFGMPRKTDLWRCPKCGQAPCACAPSQSIAAGNPLEQKVEQTKMSSVETQVAEHDRTLQIFEERIRKLEKESVVQKIKERRAEEATPPGWVN